MRKTKIGVAVRQIVQLALASSAGASVHACTGSGPVTAIDERSDAGADPAFADEATFACEAPLPPLLAELTPATPVDYVELRIQKYLYDDGGLGDRITAEAHGTACATATDVDACMAKLDAAGPGSLRRGWRFDGDHEGPSARSDYQLLVVTRGDDVDTLSTTAEVRSFLGSIDTFGEARLLLLTGNNPLECTPAGRSGWRKNDDGSFEFLLAGAECGGFMPYRRQYRVEPNGTVTLVAKNEPSTARCGRRPDGLRKPVLRDHGVGAFFAHAAHLEAASVIAFRRLERELRGLRAPASLVARARRARQDEVRHAAETTALARRFGSETPRVEVTPFLDRPAFAIALENAVEGCVGETYGALVAAFQAERALPELRPLLRQIAKDEAAHAELAHDIAHWLDEHVLTPPERAAIERARRSALEDLREAICHEPHEELVRIAGVPTRSEARVLLDGLEGLIPAAA